MSAAKYLYVGLHGKNGLVPWIWTAIVLNGVGALVLLHQASGEKRWLLNTACVMTFAGVWIEMGMGKDKG